MSKWLRAAAVSHGVSLAAMEEASRFASKDADVEHLLLALVLDPGAAGEALRATGVTLDRARAAVVDERQAQLESLGLRADAPTGQTIVFHDTAGYELTDRATTVLNRSVSGGATGDSAAVLTALLAEPSGVVRALLARLEVDVDALEGRLRSGGVSTAGRPRGRRRSPASHATRTTFVPAPVHEVRALLADGASIPRWDSTFEDVVDRDEHWEGRTRQFDADGRPARVPDPRRPQRVQRIVSLTSLGEDRIGWRFTFDHADTAHARTVVFTTVPEAEGTRLTTEVRWQIGRSRRRRRILRRVLRPFQRYILYAQVTQIGSGVSRAFR